MWFWVAVAVYVVAALTTYSKELEYHKDYGVWKFYTFPEKVLFLAIALMFWWLDSLLFFGIKPPRRKIK